jgi:hypothetical protein
MIFLLPFFFQSCETEGFVEVNEEASFFIEGDIEGQSFKIQAGEAGVANNTNVIDQNDRWDYLSSFTLENNPTIPFNKLSFKFNDFQKITDEAELKSVFLEGELDYVLNFTGVEGVVLNPETSSIVDPFVTAWSIDGLNISTQISPIIPLAFLEESEYVDVRYNLNIANKFRGSIISQFSQELDESCHAEILMNTDGMALEVLLNPLSGDFDQIEWSDGSNNLSTVIPLEAQELVVEASTAACQLSAQIEITDPSSIPEKLSYDFVMSEGPASFLSNTGLIVEIVRKDGVVFRSDFVQQSSNSELIINSINLHEFKSNNLDTYEFSSSMKLLLSNIEGTEVISIDLSDISFALSHPNP